MLFCLTVYIRRDIVKAWIARKAQRMDGMKKQNTYIAYFDDENDAIARCYHKNQACKRAGNYRDIYAVVDGPEDNYAVVDLSTAIDLGFGYKIAG